MPILKVTIKDKVTGETLPGASILINGEGKASDSQGNALFVLKNNNYQGQVRFLGYKPQTINVALYDNTDLLVGMEPDTSLLSEIEVKAKKTYKWLWVLGASLAAIYILKRWKK